MLSAVISWTHVGTIKRGLTYNTGSSSEWENYCCEEAFWNTSKRWNIPEWGQISYGDQAPTHSSTCRLLCWINMGSNRATKWEWESYFCWNTETVTLLRVCMQQRPWQVYFRYDWLPNTIHDLFLSIHLFWSSLRWSTARTKLCLLVAKDGQWHFFSGIRVLLN